MKLYTFQPLFVWENLVELGYYHPYDVFNHSSFVELDDLYQGQWGFKDSYLWLHGQMKEQKISYLANDSHVIWAYYLWNGSKQPKPDKRYSSVCRYFNDLSTPYVMLELDIDDKRVCLSDYELWHFVLNYWLLEDEKTQEKFSSQYNYFNEKPLKNLLAHQQIQHSWKTIFDLKKSADILELNSAQNELGVIQATFYELFYTDVTQVHFFQHGRCEKVLNISHSI